MLYKIYKLLSLSPLGFFAYHFRKNQPNIILAYHGVQANHPSCIDPSLFHRQVLFLKEHYEIVALDEILKERGFTDKPRLSITFDDAFENINRNAMPVLRNLNIMATVYAPVNYLGKSNEWDIGSSHPLIPIMSKNEIRNLIEKGFEIGSHTQNHIRLSRLGMKDLINEIEGSKKRLEDITGHIVNSLAYPHGGRGDIDNRVLSITEKAGYSTAVTTHFGRHNPAKRRFELRRIIIWPNDELDVLKLKLDGHYDWLIPKEFMIHAIKSFFTTAIK
jgi:peptidoglycan/xylan/chitin deacetylase (PgdA/CDA1 family)